MTAFLMENEIYGRIQRLQDRLSALGVDGALMVEKTDLYYLSGTKQDAHLYIPSTEAPLLMVRKDFDRAVTESPVKKVVPLSGYSALPRLIAESGNGFPRRLGLEMDVLPANLYFLYRKLFVGTEMVDISKLIREVRMIKSAHEIACVAEAAGIADAMYEQVPEFLTPAGTELELAIKVENYYRKMGHPGIVPVRGFNVDAVYGHIMAGKNAALPSNSPGPTGGRGLGAFYSQGAGNEKIIAHTPILIDYCASHKGYIADSTRIFSIGRLKDPLRHTHQVMLEVQDTVARKGLPGVKAEYLYRLALGIVEKAGLPHGFMGSPRGVPFVGHGIGLELDEWPVIGRKSQTLLQEGMVIALEPKMAFPGQGVVGIENTFVVTGSGMKKLNRFSDDIMTCF